MPTSPPSVALVTGASGALGGVAARTLAARGLRVGLHCNAGVDAARALAAELDIDTAVVAADLGEAGGPERCVAEAAEALGAVEVLVHCAAVRTDGLLMAQDPDQWVRMVDVNLVGTYRLNRAVVGPMVRARFGRIVNVVSPVALFGNAGQSGYSASKAGVVALTRALAKEVGSRGVTVNALSPGFVESDITGDVPAAARDRLLARTALGRPGRADELAPGIEFLLDASYVTGQVVSLDGGMTP